MSRTIILRPVVRFREFPLGTIHDPSMTGHLSDHPCPDQDKMLVYLRSGSIFSIPMGGAVDSLDRANRANPMIDGRFVSGLTEMTDGEWYWPAALIHYVETYNLTLPTEFVEHAAHHGWRVKKEALCPARYEFSYFDHQTTEASTPCES